MLCDSFIGIASVIIMFRSRITLEEYLKSVQHEDEASEDVSLDDIDMIPDSKEEEVEHVRKNIFESRVSINMNPSLINIPDNFKDDKEDIAVDIVKRKTGASEVVFSEAIVPIETFVYHKLMGPESSGRVRRVRYRVTSTQRNAKRNCQSRIEPSDSSIGDNVEENQKNNTPLVGEPIRDSLIATPTLAKNNEVYIKDAGQIENTIVLMDKGGASHTSRSPHVLNQSYDQNTSMGENMNTSGCSNQSNIARRLNFDQREQLKRIQGVSKGDRLTATPSPLSRELMCSKVINPYATTQAPVFFLNMIFVKLK
ncbi:hypothetical protein Cgig2_017974 [Carnegiea gigantea]|uniref:Uncharacterized protein n=1 Tax=Carnegiea gigantea TaxID=171969 RepID=A0A9Q1GP20_9CARY|nr:hypothetical protein Cgig2_017974 [Carnegiea gigantea]